MSLICYAKRTKDKVQLQEKPFASGGEGSLHRIKSPPIGEDLWPKFTTAPNEQKSEKRKSTY